LVVEILDRPIENSWSVAGFDGAYEPGSPGVISDIV